MGDWARIDTPAERRDHVDAAAPMPIAPAARVRIKRTDRIVLGSIDAGADVFQRHAREVLFGSAVFLVPAVLLNLVLSTVLFDRFESFSDSVVSVPELIGGVDSATGADTVLAYAGVITTSLAVALVGGYVARLYVDATFANPVSIRRALGATVRHLPALLVAWLLGHVWFLLGAVGIVRAHDDSLVWLAVVGGSIGLLLVALVLVVSPVVVVERSGPVAGLRRAVRLARLRFGACVSFVLAAGVVGLALRFGITFLPRLAEATGLVRLGSWGGLLEGVAGQLAQLLTIPLVGLATAAFYVQLRVHTEGLDLVLAADRAFDGAAAP